MHCTNMAGGSSSLEFIHYVSLRTFKLANMDIARVHVDPLDGIISLIHTVCV